MATAEQITALVRAIQAPKLEPYYGRNNEDPIQWLGKIQSTERQLKWGGDNAALINAEDPLTNIKIQVPFYLRENVTEWIEQ